jgi:predicted ATPase
MTKRIVITGGPGTGKTVLVRELEKKGYSCFHEIIREMTDAARKEEDPGIQLVNPLTFVRDPLAFNRRILRGRIGQFMAASHFHDPLVFYDRGIPDVLAYMDYFKQEYDGEFEEPSLNFRYDRVFLLPPWREIYTTDHERLESFEQACEIHECLDKTYRRCGYEVHTLDFGRVEDRIGQMLDKLKEGHA